MGNTASLSYCCLNTIASSRSPATLIFHDGKSRVVAGKRRVAGEVMFEFPDCMVCHAHSFFIGQPLPVLTIDDELLAGQTYLVLPLDCFATNVLSASSLAALGRSPRRGGAAPANFRSAAFEYIKGSNGRVLIKVVPEFIVNLLSGSNGVENLQAAAGDDNVDDCKILCSTPELKKHYEQLVGSKDQVWSPKLETITEYKIRYSPCKFIGLEWKQKEGEGNHH
ncbi:PREDICTED: uncharacterized protein LOC109187427 [Ipomoea nil]|uniref:uncharacterized protein LOC109187427 n=1 Tax=Ipomoea nil TaxID=35883 RepID=UPI000901369C|nr:PREDICTED: uncharacterized protein LOC109187427 [Ipomoea nil]